MTTKSQTFLPLPDPPERTPDEMTNFNHISITGNAHHLMQHFGNPGATLVAGEHYISPARPESMAGLRYPDLIIAFGVRPAAYYQSNAYIISEQGKPPDFVLEIASRSTGDEDVDKKPADYAALGIPEYWRFDETGDFHKTKLAGDRLVQGHYEPIDIDVLPDGRLRGYSAVLNLILEWQDGRLNWIDPETEEHIPTFEQEREGRLQEREGRLQERQGRLQEREGRFQEREGRLQAESRADTAEARIRELEAELEQKDRGE